MHKFLALGDSYTIGEAVAEQDRWPVQLTEKLRKEAIEIADPNIIAKTGWTTDELLAAIEEQNPLAEYELVSLLIGVNNQYRGYPLEQYQQEFEVLLKKGIVFAGGDAGRLMVLSIPDYGCTPFGAEKDPGKIKSEIEAYNQLGCRLSREYGAKWFDITAISCQAKEDPELTASDGLHPSGKMYHKWVEKIFPDVVNFLRNQ